MGDFPLVAILRGIDPDNVLGVSELLLETGINHLEVPLNSPDAFESLGLLKQHLEGRATVGAGTVLSVSDVERLTDIGISMCLTPNANPSVIRACSANNIRCFAGFSTPTEAFQCVEAGTNYLKLFPADHYGVNYLGAIKAVLPADTTIYAVGGISDANLSQWQMAGANGVGIGSWLYHPSYTLSHIEQRAQALVHASKTAGVAS